MQNMYHNEPQVQESRKRLLHQELKKAALLAAVDISLKRMNRSPERCARNMMELGISVFPNRLSREAYHLVHRELVLVCKLKDPVKARELFISCFITENPN